MKTMTFKNKLNGEVFVCDNVKAVEVIDGVEFLVVHREANQRPVMMRKDILERVSSKSDKSKSLAH